MSAAKAIPEGYDELIPSLRVQGAAKALDFYEKKNLPTLSAVNGASPRIHGT
jgi:hypothetical protein